MSLQLIDLTVTFSGATKALFKPLTFVVSPGEIVTVMGPSGVGKSTLLDAVGGHLPECVKLEGHVLLEGRDVSHLPAEKRRIGMLFQDALMFPHLSVGDNLAFGLSPDTRGRESRRSAVETALEQAGLAGFHDRDPATLSGGQRARAALMRALLANPLALLLDEPFSKLDSALRGDIRGFVLDHVRDRHIPVLMVTHDESDAVALGGAIIKL